MLIDLEKEKEFGWEKEKLNVSLFKDAFWSRRSREETQNLPEGLFTSSDKRVHLDPLQGAGKGSDREMDNQVTHLLHSSASIFLLSQLSLTYRKITQHFFFLPLVTMQTIKPFTVFHPAHGIVFEYFQWELWDFTTSLTSTVDCNGTIWLTKKIPILLLSSTLARPCVRHVHSDNFVVRLEN